MAKLEFAAQGAGQRIKRIRKSLGLTMEDFGKSFNPPASKGLVGNWERGDNLPSKERLQKIAEMANTTVDEIKYGPLSEYVYNVVNHYLTTNADPATFNAYTKLSATAGPMGFEEVMEYLIITTADRCNRQGVSYGNILLIESIFGEVLQGYVRSLQDKASPANLLIVKINEILRTLNSKDLADVLDYAERLTGVIRYDFTNRPQPVKSTLMSAAQSLPPNVNERVEIPLCGSVSAGAGEYLQDEHVEYIEVFADSVPDDADYCLKVNGDSMSPMFESGDIIFVHKQQEPSDGAIMIVDVDGEAYVKKVRVDNNQLRLVSLNPAYDDIIVDKSNDSRIIGKVVFS